MSGPPPLTYDCTAFVQYLVNGLQIGYDFDFLEEILRDIDNVNDKIKIKAMIGILPDPSDSSKNLPPNLSVLYDNWSDFSTVSSYIGIVSTYFAAKGTNLINPISLWTQLSSFILNFYFCYNAPPQFRNAPMIAAPGSKFYFLQTDYLLRFFRVDTSRGIGNVFIDSYCEEILRDIDNKNKYLSQNPRIMQWCGCFADIDEFMTEDIDLPPECSPICINSDSVQLFDNEGNEKICLTAICIISDISIKTVQTPNGYIVFNQLCTACEKNRDQICLCIIDSSVLSLLGKIGAGDSGLDVPVNFNLYCPNAICLLVDEVTREVEPIDCNKFNPAATGIEPVSSTGLDPRVSIDDSSTILFMLISFFLIFLSIGIFSFGKKLFVKKSSF